MAAEPFPAVEAPAPFVVARHRRAELQAGMVALERALAVPAAEAGWADRLRRQVDELRRAFAHHVTATEGPDGMYADILLNAPRLSHRVKRLTGEHADATAAIDALVKLVADAPDDLDQAWVDRVRDEATTLVASLERHRQRGADLVWEAYHLDIGGCD